MKTIPYSSSLFKNILFYQKFSFPLKKSLAFLDDNVAFSAAVHCYPRFAFYCLVTAVNLSFE